MHDKTVEARHGRATWRVLLWSVATAVIVAWAFQAGVESFDREHCGPEATDCDLGFLRGAPWAGLALLGMAAVIVGVEAWLRRLRRTTGDKVPAGRPE